MSASLRMANGLITEPAAFFARAGFSSDPFPEEPARGTFAATSVHEPARAQLLQWVNDLAVTLNREERLGVITGEDGTGKTRLLAAVEDTLTSDRRLHVVSLPDVPSHRTDAQLLKALLIALGGKPAGRTGLELRGEVRDILRVLQHGGSHVGLLMDDADFKGSQLELVRNLLRDAEGTGLWIILAGTPDLHDRLIRRRSLRGLLGPVISLEALGQTDTDLLLTGRIDAVRTLNAPEEVFAPDVRAEIHRWSAGNPGQVIRAARAALLLMMEQGERTVSLSSARHAMRALTISDANDARSEVAAAVGSPIQTRMDLLDEQPSGASSATTQRSLWGEEGSV